MFIFIRLQALVLSKTCLAVSASESCPDSARMSCYFESKPSLLLGLASLLCLACFVFGQFLGCFLSGLLFVWTG